MSDVLKSPEVQREAQRFEMVGQINKLRNLKWGEEKYVKDISLEFVDRGNSESEQVFFVFDSKDSQEEGVDRIEGLYDLKKVKELLSTLLMSYPYDGDNPAPTFKAGLMDESRVRALREFLKKNPPEEDPSQERFDEWVAALGSKSLEELESELDYITDRPTGRPAAPRTGLSDHYEALQEEIARRSNK